MPARSWRACADGRRIVLMIDQTRATERHRVVMVAARVGGRALPLAWRVEATAGTTGLAEQRQALEAVGGPLPPGARPGLVGGPFHRTPPAIARGRPRGCGGGPRAREGQRAVRAGGGG